MEDVLVSSYLRRWKWRGDSRVCANGVSLFLQGPHQDKVTSFPFHSALRPQRGVAAAFSMDFQERVPPSLAVSTQSAKPGSVQQV